MADKRNIKITSTQLVIAEHYTCEYKEIIDWWDEGETVIWTKGGGIHYRNPTVEEVKEWLKKN
jgi:molybdopterin biosynthesis enzyme MoaB